MIKKLKQTKQCAKCPWKTSTNPHDIPGEYSVEKHEALLKTITKPSLLNWNGSPMYAMACHESDPGQERYCIGWLVNQLGVGNNLALRIQMMNYDLSEVKTFGSQHRTLDETLPQNKD